jgi:hypothetical protein
MVACGTSGLFGGRRVPLFVADNSLIPAVCFPAVAFALVVVLALPTRGFRSGFVCFADVLFAVAFLVVAFLAMIIFLLTTDFHFI